MAYRQTSTVHIMLFIVEICRLTQYTCQARVRDRHMITVMVVMMVMMMTVVVDLGPIALTIFKTLSRD